MGSKKLFSDEPTTRTELYEAALVKIKDVCEDDDPAYLIAEAILEYTDGRRYNTSSGKTKPPSFTLPTGGGKGGGSNEGKELQPA